MLLSLHPNIIVHVGNVVSLFSSPSTSSQKVRKCGGHNFLTETCEFLPLLLWSCSSLQRCCWKTMLLSLHPNVIVHVENVVSLFSSPRSQKVRKCGGHNFFFSGRIVRELEQNQFDHYTHPCVPTVYACGFLVACGLCARSTKASKDRKYPGITFMYGISPRRTSRSF